MYTQANSVEASPSGRATFRLRKFLIAKRNLESFPSISALPTTASRSLRLRGRAEARPYKNLRQDLRSIAVSKARGAEFAGG